MVLPFHRLRDNGAFLADYRGHVVKDWADSYFSYDYFKQEYKMRKGKSYVELDEFDQSLLHEIQRVHEFLLVNLEAIAEDLNAVDNTISSTNDGNLPERVERSLELSLRSLFRKIYQCEMFFQLNHFAISKICKKLEKLPLRAPLNDLNQIPETQALMNEANRERERTHRRYLGGSVSGDYFYTRFFSTSVLLESVRQHCIDLYSRIFRQTYQQLALYELKFAKNKDRDSKNVRFFAGIKLGIAICMIIWILVDDYTSQNDMNFWLQPGMYVYTTIGSLLLYRLGWAMQVYVWSHYEISYISILQLNNQRPNLVQIVDQIANLSLMFSTNLLVFFKTNPLSYESRKSVVHTACPALLILGLVTYIVYEWCFAARGSSNGVFSLDTLIRCCKAPFVPVSFRDAFVADTLTSFTKILSDSLYASCWLVSGAFLESEKEATANEFGSSYAQCTGHDMVVAASLVQLIPLTIRMFQCLRCYRDSGMKAFRHVFNALKYLGSIAVVLLGLSETSGLFVLVYIVVVIVTLYKWWWDIAMDWGLWKILPRDFKQLAMVNLYAQTNMWLRDLILYPSQLLYHLCVVLDLLLRYAWVISLLPVAPAWVAQYQLTLLLGSLEVCRRSVWGCFRLEWEHLQLFGQGAPGILRTRILVERMRGRKRGDSDTEEQKYEPQQCSNDRACSP